jgi:hypothetical protein
MSRSLPAFSNRSSPRRAEIPTTGAEINPSDVELPPTVPINITAWLAE